MAMTFAQLVGGQNVPKQKTPNVVPGTGSLAKPGANIFNTAQGLIDAGPQGGPANYGSADIAQTFAPVMTKAAQPGRWSDLATPTAADISADWEPLQVEASGSQQVSDAEASFQKALRQAFGDYGGDISKVGDWSKYIDAPTIEKAQQNKYSTTAEALQAYSKALARSRSSLAAKGMLSSGRTALQTKEALDAREKAEYAGLRTFTGGAEEGMQKIGTLRQQIADKLVEARRNAADRWAAAHPAVWNPPTEAEYSQPEYAPAAPAAAPPPAYNPSPELDREQAYYQSRATPITAPPPKKKKGMSFGTMVGGQY